MNLKGPCQFCGKTGLIGGDLRFAVWADGTHVFACVDTDACDRRADR